MKNNLNVASVALALFLTGQSVQAMENDNDKSKNPPVKQEVKKKNLSEILDGHLERKKVVVSQTLADLWLWWTGQTNQSTQQ